LSRACWAVALTLAACSGSDSGTGQQTAGGVIVDPVDDASYVFDPAIVRTYDIQLAAADLATLNANPSAEQYVTGSVRIDGVDVPSVGVRYKGSVGAFLRPCTASRLGEPAGAKTGKCSIKLAFDHVDPDGRFHGLRKLNLHSMNHDPSMMRDRLGYEMFRQTGVPASRAVHARVLFNGALEGLFAVVEEVDGRFTRTRFPDGGEGNLYKEIWPYHTDPAAYLAALQTNEDEMPSVEKMLGFSAAIGEGMAAMESWIDRDMTLRYLAADRVMINDDGIFHWWCSAGGQGNNPGGLGNHNYFWYEATNESRLWLIPWDMDSAFAGSDFVRIEPAWNEPGQCTCSQRIGAQRAASCDPLIKLWAEWGVDYEQAVDAFIEGPFAAENVDPLLGAWEAQISDAVQEAAGRNSAPSVSAWHDALQSLRAGIASMRANRGRGQ
jgi:spore coat protein H